MPDETVIGGEIVALESGRPSFNALQNYETAMLIYYVFDVMILAGKAMMNEPLGVRRQLLQENVLARLGKPIRESPEPDASLPDLTSSIKAQGLEGRVAKRRDSRYEPGQRSGAWQKMRFNRGQVFVIGGYTRSARNFDAFVFGYFEGREAAVCWAHPQRIHVRIARLFKRFKTPAAETCPFVNLPKAKSRRWGTPDSSYFV
jgi:ATP-dependent DNA ligase